MEKLAEFIGILLGDGSISIYKLKSKERIVDYYRLKISLNSEDDVEYVDYVKNLFYDLFDFYPIIKYRKNEKVCNIMTFRRKIINYFLDLGMKSSPKWGRAVIPDIFLKDELMKFVVRGYFDTDGSVVLAHNHNILYPRVEMKICPSEMQKQMIIYLKKKFEKVYFYEIGKGMVRMQLNGIKNLRKWFDKIGFSNPKHKRKAEQFLN